MSWSLYFLVIIIFVGSILTIALFGAMFWLARRKDSEEQKTINAD